MSGRILHKKNLIENLLKFWVLLPRCVDVKLPKPKMLLAANFSLAHPGSFRSSELTGWVNTIAFSVDSIKPTTITILLVIFTWVNWQSDDENKPQPTHPPRWGAIHWKFWGFEDVTCCIVLPKSREPSKARKRCQEQYVKKIGDSKSTGSF